MELTAGRTGRSAEAVGDIAVQTAVEHVRRGRPLHRDGARRLGDLGAVRRLRGGHWRCARRAPRARSPVRPASSATTSRWPRSRRSTSWSPRCASGRTVLAQRVEMTQEGRPVLDAMVWSVGDVAGPRARGRRARRRCPSPRSCPPRADLAPDEDRPAMPLLGQLRPALIEWSEQWPPPGPLAADLADLGALPAHRHLRRPVGRRGALAHRARRGELAGRAHARTCIAGPPFIAPSLDLYASFQYPGVASEWLLLDAHSPVAHAGLLSWTGRVWSHERRLIASGGGQAVFRHI